MTRPRKRSRPQNSSAPVRVRKRRRPAEPPAEADTPQTTTPRPRKRANSTRTKLVQGLAKPGELLDPFEMHERRPAGIIDVGVPQHRSPTGFYMKTPDGMHCYTFMGLTTQGQYKYIGKAGNIKEAFALINTQPAKARAADRDAYANKIKAKAKSRLAK